MLYRKENSFKRLKDLSSNCSRLFYWRPFSFQSSWIDFQPSRRHPIRTSENDYVQLVRHYVPLWDLHFGRPEAWEDTWGSHLQCKRNLELYILLKNCAYDSRWQSFSHANGWISKGKHANTWNKDGEHSTCETSACSHRVSYDGAYIVTITHNPSSKTAEFSINIRLNVA